MIHTKKTFALSLLFVLLVIVAGCKKEPEPTPSEKGPQRPRYMTAMAGKVYVTCYNPTSVIRIDTASLKVEAVCRLGNYQPEGIAIAGNKLFVASSWVYDANSNVLYDNKVYVIDINTFRTVGTIEVGLNPERLKAIDGNHLIVCCNGNYGSVTGNSYIIDATTLTATATNIDISGMDVYNGVIYAYSAPYNVPDKRFLKLNPTTLADTTILEQCNIENPYGLNVIDGDIYLTTATASAKGDVYRLSPAGEQRWMSEAGVYTSKVVALGDGSAYVLNQGFWGGNDASLSRVDLATGQIDNNVFSAANARNLGDIAQDILVYGSKAYVTVTFSNTIEVVSIKDNTSKRINL